MSALTALAEDLRHLEDLSRDSEERTHKTFKALHETLVHIADRLDGMEDRGTADRPDADGRRRFRCRSLCADGGRSRDGQDAGRCRRTEGLAGDPHGRGREQARASARPGTGQRHERNERDRHRSATRTAGDAGHAPAKSSLLASLGKRLLPGKKAESRATRTPGDRPRTVDRSRPT